MKNRFNIIVRGTVDYESQDALEAAVAEKLSAVSGFTQTYGAYEVWQDNEGQVRDFNGKKRFTLQINGTMVADSRADIQSIISKFVAAYSEFVLTYSSIDVWMSQGQPSKWNDDGTPYVQPVAEEEPVEVEVEEV